MSVRRHTVYNLMGSLIPIALALVTVPLYIHQVGPERYGVLAIAWLLLGYFGLFDLGLGRATSFRIAALKNGSAEARSTTFWTALAVNAAMGFVGALVLLPSAAYFFENTFKVDEQIRGEVLMAVPLLALSVPVATITGVLTGALQGREKFLQTNVVSVISTSVFQFGPLLVALTYGPNLPWLIASSILARLLAVVVLFYLCRTEITRGLPMRVASSEIRALLTFGGWVTVTAIVGPLLVVLDRFLIGAVLGAAAVAVYTVPFQLAQRIAVLPNALATALFPAMSWSSAEERRAMAGHAILVLASVLSLPVLAAVFLIDPFLHLWVGSNVGAQSAPVARLLLIGFWANAFALMPFTRLQASGRPDLVTAALALQVMAYVPALWFCLDRFGLVGAAAVFALRCIVDYVILTVFADRDFQGWSTLLANLLMLLAGAWAADAWSYGDSRWWAAVGLLGVAMAGFAWLTLPTAMKSEILRRGAAVLQRSPL